MSTTNAAITISPQTTPNPHSTRYAVNRPLLEGPGCDFPNSEVAKASLLARELFLLDGVTGVFIGPDFVTVTVKPGTNTWVLEPAVMQTIESHVLSGDKTVETGAQPAAVPPATWSDIEAGIVRVLETEIRPAVAMDGGDILFDGFKDGVVRLRLRGACHSCPSSLLTLKAGIENRLKQEFPQITSVEAV